MAAVMLAVSTAGCNDEERAACREKQTGEAAALLAQRGVPEPKKKADSEEIQEIIAVDCESLVPTDLDAMIASEAAWSLDDGDKGQIIRAAEGNPDPQP